MFRTWLSSMSFMCLAGCTACTGGPDFPVLTALSQAATLQAELRLYEDGEQVVAYEDAATVSGPLEGGIGYLIVLAPAVDGVVFLELDIYYTEDFERQFTCPNFLGFHESGSSGAWLGIDLTQAFSITNTRWKKRFSCDPVDGEDLDAWADVSISRLTGTDISVVFAAYEDDGDREVRVEFDASVPVTDVVWP